MKISGAIVIALVLGIAALAVAMDAPPEETEVVATPEASETAPPVVTADMHKLSTAEDGKVTLVEFLDFECEACGAAFPVVKQILAEYEGRLTYVVRDFPNHNNSVLAASAAYAAGEQGKYWEMYDLLFERQTTWAERQDSQAAVFLGFAEELGLDMAKFQTDLESGRYVDRIARDFDDARRLGVDATPTFYINGVKFVGVLPYDEFKRRIDQAIDAAS